MDMSKAWFLSRTVWAALVTVVVAVLGIAGVAVENDSRDALTDLLLHAATAVAGIVALLGRLVARSRIG
jgi:hypothetical protein